MSSGQACRPCRGSCSPIPGRSCYGDLLRDEIIVSPPSPTVEPFWHHIQGVCLGLRYLRRGENSTACYLQDIKPQGQQDFLTVLQGSDGALHASGHRRLHVRQQYNRRIHHVDRHLLIRQQNASSSVASAVRRLDGRSNPWPIRSSAYRQGRRVHRGGVSIVLPGDRYYPSTRRYQYAAANRCVRTRGKDSVRHGSVHARRQRL